MSLFYDIPFDILKHLLLYVPAQDVCAFRRVDRYARLIAPFVPHTRGPISHLIRPPIVGTEEAFTWMIKHKTIRFEFVGCYDLAAGYGFLDLLKILHVHFRHLRTTMAMDLASKKGHFEVVNWLHENQTEGGSTEATEAMDGAVLSPMFV